MNISIIGTGYVATTLADAWSKAGHRVTLGSRNPGSTASRTGHPVTSISDAVTGANVVVNATPGASSLASLTSIPADLYSGKVLIDVSNATTPTYDLVYPDSSLAQLIQDALPDAKVVKSMNTADMSVITDPSVIGDSSVFLSGDHEDAKETVRALLADLGWKPGDIVDLGGVETAHATEHYLYMFLALRAANKNPHFNIRLVR